jgi:hypothetical protein
MYTLGQWQDIRRVDHFKFVGVSFSRGFYIANPRWRQFDANDRPDLKGFDQYVTAFNLAQSPFDRMSALGEIISLGYHFIQGRQAPAQANDRYNNAVDALYNRAIIDMNLIAGHLRQQAMEHHITGVARPARTIQVNVLLIKPSAVAAPAGDAITINAQIANANASAAFQNAQIAVNQVGGIVQVHEDAHHQSFLLGAAAPLHVRGTFQDSAVGGDRLIDYCNGLPRTADMDVVFVDGFDQADVQGRTFRAQNDYNGHTALRPIIAIRLTPVVGGAATHPTTLVHEFGHALCSEPSHSADANNLMAGGANRTGIDNLSAGLNAWFCNNPYIN